MCDKCSEYNSAEDFCKLYLSSLGAKWVNDLHLQKLDYQLSLKFPGEKVILKGNCRITGFQLYRS